MYIKGGKVYKSDNSLIGNLQDAPFGKNDATVVYQYGEDGTSRRPWNHEMRYGADGKPVLFYSHQLDKNTIDYYMAIWDETQSTWVKKWVADAGDALIPEPMSAPDGTTFGGSQIDYAGGITLNPYNTNEIFISANVDPRNGQETAKYEIYKGTIINQGDSFQWEAVTSDSPDNNYRPFVPFGAKKASEQVVVWFTGKYESFVNGYKNLQSTGESYYFKGYDSKVVGKYINRSTDFLKGTCQAVSITPDASNTTGYGGSKIREQHRSEATVSQLAVTAGKQSILTTVSRRIPLCLSSSNPVLKVKSMLSAWITTCRSVMTSV